MRWIPIRPTDRLDRKPPASRTRRRRLCIVSALVLSIAADSAFALSPGEVVINEVLYDGTVDGDPNGDETSDAVEDEFIEILNITGSSVDLTGATLIETTFGAGIPRHVFPATTLPAGEAIVIFGGGSPSGSFGGSQVVVCSACFGGGAMFGLALNDDSDTLTLRAADTTTVDSVTWGPGAASDESITRDPDGTGAFTLHSVATGSMGAVFSAGFRVNGDQFSGTPVDPPPAPGDLAINEVLFDGTAGDANGDAVVDAIEDEFVEIINLSGTQLDLSGLTLAESDFGTGSPRHVFAPSTLLSIGERIVIFGGGTPIGTFGGSQVLVCSACGDPTGLDLDDDGDTLTLRASDTTVLDTVSWLGGDASGESITRSPEGTGSLVAHSDALTSGGTIYSPGVPASEGEPPPPPPPGEIYPGEVVINEVLYDGSVDGDPNGDGTLDAVEDEFIELVNVSGVQLNLTGAVLTELTFGTGTPRHVFPLTLLDPGEAIVIFGGGTPTGSFGGSQVVVCSACSGGSAMFGLALNDDGDTLTLRADDLSVIDEVSWGPGAVTDESLVRSPEGSGAFVPHSSAAGSVGDYSPGIRANGALFPLALGLPALGGAGVLALSGLLALGGAVVLRRRG